MPNSPVEFDAVVVGSGPAGVNAALTASSHGATTLLVERERNVGGACVQYGTIPSKTIRETAVALTSFERRSGDVFQVSRDEDLTIESLLTRLHRVVEAHQATTQRQLDFAGVQVIQGRAEFESPHELAIRSIGGQTKQVIGDNIFIAAGSRPRSPIMPAVDHENILDSDSILSMTYLPGSIAVLGSGVIACEYASTLATLGVEVVIIDKYPSPLGFLDRDLVTELLERFAQAGIRYCPRAEVAAMAWDGVSQVVTTLESGETIRTDKAFVAQGRIANTDQLGLSKAGVDVCERGFIRVDKEFRTNVPTIFAVGDVIGPPSLASSSIHQGRHAAGCAFGTNSASTEAQVPMGIYTIPEIASVGLSEQQAREKAVEFASATCHFGEIARGQIIATTGGFLKVIAETSNDRIIGVQIIGETATELIHIGQLAIASNMTIRDLATTNFNFPTLAEAYRVAALRILENRQTQSLQSAAVPELV